MAIFFIDFDNTLFDSPKFKRYLAEKLGMSEKSFIKKYLEHLNTDIDNDNFHRNFFTTKGFIDFLKRQSLLESSFDEEIFHGDLMERMPSFVDRATRDVLSELCGAGDTLIIVSAGNEEFQRFKIKHSGVEKYFKDIIVTDHNKDEYILEHIRIDALDGEAKFFIDDKKHYLDIVNNSFNKEMEKIKLIHITKGESPYLKAESFVEAIDRLDKKYNLLNKNKSNA